jgi:hypothetical protein
MLIRDAIEAAKAAGLLIPARPIVPWAGEPRVFLMCQSLHRSIKNGRSHDDERVRRRWAQLEADIGHFVQGGRVTESLLKQLKPEKFEHWWLRSRTPRPSMRVFGRFAECDVFVGTHVGERSQYGGMWSPEVEHEKFVCEDHWNNAGLAGYKAFSGSKYDDYISDNASRSIRIRG